ncbi:DUF4979 domain-containing protein [Flavobacterium sp. Sd200]|uniref:DUF4979 domain-containing protein n=1 Tax=Flavobacterium sp. Sd200 TaxID=2692211 RepID=UPI00136C6C2F|nr:DUF4979 domain-containing protein [Flavobacterium sp. Sd200]MXN90768.1 DUF4979 domain-containing protein [Flavobacterium sp. Sd200]
MKNTKLYSILAVCLLMLAAALQFSCSDMETEYEGEPLVKYPEITVTGFSPQAGPPSAAVTITGTNFGQYSAAAKIFFNGIPATDIVSYSDTQIVVRAPEGATTGPITVKVWTHTVVTPDNFTYLPGAAITAITPAEGMPGDHIFIQGSNFGTEVSNIAVQFPEGVAAEVVSVTDTEIEVIVPTGGVTGNITADIGLQTITGPQFLYLDAYPPGKYLFEFDDPTDVQWITVQNSAYTIRDGKLVVTFDAAQFNGTAKRRADLQYIINGALLGQAKDPWVYTSDFPILAIKFTKPATGNMILDMNGGAFPTNSQNNTYAAQNVYYYDMSTRITDPTVSKTTFQFKIADITSPETGYEVEWIGTFRSVAEMEEFMN